MYSTVCHGSHVRAVGRELKKIIFLPPSTCPADDLFGPLANGTTLKQHARPRLVLHASVLQAARPTKTRTLRPFSGCAR